MAVYTRNGARSVRGQAIGILQLDCMLPFVPGDVDNASSYAFPIAYKVVPGLSAGACLGGAPELTEAVVAAAVELEAQGVLGISSDCGFMLQFQEAVCEAVRIPVAMSSLLLLPMISSAFDPRRPIAVLTANSDNLTPEFLAGGGVSVANPIIIRGLQNKPEFKAALFDEKGSLDSALIALEMIEVVRELVAAHSDLAAILLECSMMPPYSQAVQEEVGLPVFDFVNMIEYLQSVTHQRSYEGSGR